MIKKHIKRLKHLGYDRGFDLGTSIVKEDREAIAYALVVIEKYNAIKKMIK